MPSVLNFPKLRPQLGRGNGLQGCPGGCAFAPVVTFSTSGKAGWQLVPVGLIGEPDFRLAKICIIHYMLEEDTFYDVPHFGEGFSLAYFSFC